MFDSVRFDSFRFGSVGEKSSRLILLTNYSSNLMRTKSKSNRTEPNRIESKRKQSNRNEPNRKLRKIFLVFDSVRFGTFSLKVLELSELFEPNRIETNSEYALNSRVSL
jgi:hypothetical protein